MRGLGLLLAFDDVAPRPQVLQALEGGAGQTQGKRQRTFLVSSAGASSSLQAGTMSPQALGSPGVPCSEFSAPRDVRPSSSYPPRNSLTRRRQTPAAKGVRGPRPWSGRVNSPTLTRPRRHSKPQTIPTTNTSVTEAGATNALTPRQPTSTRTSTLPGSPPPTPTRTTTPTHTHADTHTPWLPVT